MSDLPEFEKRPKHKVVAFINSALGGNHLVRLQEYDDGHFRAVFRRSYFNLPDDEAVPSQSQWSTLKKRLKRRDHDVFIFKQHGQVTCTEEAETDTCYYIDFGFFLY